MAGRLMAPDQMTEHCLSNDDSTAPSVTNKSPSFKNGPENEDMDVNSVHKCAENDFKVISGRGTVSRVEKKNAGLIVNNERDNISAQEPLELADKTHNEMVPHLVKTHPDRSDSFVGDCNPISPETSSSEVATNGDEKNKEVRQNEQEISESDIDYLEDMRIFEQMDNAGQPKGPMEWIMRQMSMDTNPRDIITHLIPGVMVPNHLDDLTLWKGIWELITEPKARTKLNDVNTIEDVIKLIEKSKKIIVLTGAGVSVSCGIPDFRSRDGIYARLSKDFPDLPDPQSMFDIHYFRRDQRPFFKFAKEIYPGQFKPSLSHMFIAALDKKEKLLRNYTQNIDTLEQTAGIERVVQCHGSFATASCTNCKYKVASDVIRDDIFNQVIPTCKNCSPDESTLAVMKPDIIFFGEGLPDAFYQNLDVDKLEADLLIVIGSSLKVRPVALIPDYLKPNVPQILINREPLHHFNFDVELLGNCDAVIAELCHRLGEDWNEVVQDYVMPPLDKDAIGMMFESSSESGSVHSHESVDFDAGLAGDGNQRVPSKDPNEYCYENESCSGTTDFKGNDEIDKNKCVDDSSVKVDLNQVMVEDTSVEVNISQVMVEGEPVETDRVKCEDESKDSHINFENRQSKILATNCSLQQSTKENMDPKFLPDNENNPRKRELERICEKCEMLKDIRDGKIDEKSATKEGDVFEDVKIGASVDSGFVSNCTESSEDTNNAEREVQCTCSVGNKRIKLEAESREDENMTEGEPSGSELAGPSDEKDSKHTGEGIGEKRKARISLRPSSPSFNKESVMEKFENEDVFYLLVPPNRYIFHGAEIDRHISFMPESDSSSSQDDMGGTRKPWEEDDGENSNATVPEGGQLMEPNGPGSSTKIESHKGKLYGDVSSATDGESLHSVENHVHHVQESEKLPPEQTDVTKSVGESRVLE